MGRPDESDVNEWRRAARQNWHRMQVLLADGDGAGFCYSNAGEGQR